MRAARAAAMDGGLSVVVLAGEAGIGKTRLVGDFGREVETSGGVALTGSCVRVDGESLPFLPWVQILRVLPGKFDAGSAARILGPARAEVARLVPELGEVRAPDPAAAMVGRLRLFELIGGVAERLAQARPAVLVIEDVQWADPASLDLLSFITRTVRSGRLMLVVTQRTDEPGSHEATDRILGDIVRGRGVDWIDVEPLDVDGVRAQATAILGHRPSVDEAQRLATRAGGNPFLVEEILASGSVEAAGSRGLIGLLRRRVHNISPAQRTVLAIVAIAGGFVDDTTVHRVSRLTEAVTETALHAALDAGLLVRSGDGYVFRHGLMAEAVEGDLLPAEQRRLHALLAVTLSARRPRMRASWQGSPGTGSAPVGLVARWTLRGSRPVRPSARSRSRRRHCSTSAHSNSISGCQMRVPRPTCRSSRSSRGRRRWRRLPAGPPEPSNWREPGSPSSRALLPRCSRRSRPCTAGCAGPSLDMGEDGAAIADAQASLVLQDGAPPPEGWTNALAHHAGLLHSLGRFSEALVVADFAVEAAVGASERADEAVGLGVGGWSLIWLGRPDEGLERIDRAVAIARELAIPHGLGLALRHRAAAARFCRPVRRRV